MITITRNTEKVGDTRWVHRPFFDWERADLRSDQSTAPGRIDHGLLRLVQVHQQNFAFTRAETEIADSGNPHVFGYFRQHAEQSVLVLANFSEQGQDLAANRLRLLGLRKTFTAIIVGKTITATETPTLEPYQFMILLGSR